MYIYTMLIIDEVANISYIYTIIAIIFTLPIFTALFIQAFIRIKIFISAI